MQDGALRCGRAMEGEAMRASWQSTVYAAWNKYPRRVPWCERDSARRPTLDVVGGYVKRSSLVSHVGWETDRPVGSEGWCGELGDVFAKNITNEHTAGGRRERTSGGREGGSGKGRVGQSTSSVED